MRDHSTRQTGYLRRDQRHPAALSPDYFLIDERDEADLLARADPFARLLTYFDQANKADYPDDPADAKWRAFFARDVRFLLAEIATYQDHAYGADIPGRRAAASIDEGVRRTVLRLGAWAERAFEITRFGAADATEQALSDRFEFLLLEQVSPTLPSGEAIRLGDPTARSHRLIMTPPTVLPSKTAPAYSAFDALRRTEEELRVFARTLLASDALATGGAAAQTALYTAFAGLTRHARAEVNSVTDRHLTYYYRDILGLAPSPATPDVATVLFAIDKGGADVTAAKGLRLIGRTPDAPRMIYRTDEDLLVTGARIAALRALRVERGGPGDIVTAIDAFEDVAQMPAQETAAWPMFGHASRPVTPGAGLHGESVEAGGVGAVFASPALRLAEGERRITLTLTLAATGLRSFAEEAAHFAGAAIALNQGTAPDLNALIRGGLSVSLSTAKGYHDALLGAATLDTTAQTLTLSTMLPKEAPPIAPFPVAIATANRPAETDAESEAHMRLSLSPDATVCLYSLFSHLRVVHARIDVGVRGLSALSLNAPSGPLDPTKPFAPFGLMPEIGDALVFSARDFAQKSVTRMTMRAQWLGLPTPPETLADHYEGYGVDAGRDVFQARLSIGDGEGWRAPTPLGAPAPPPVMLFGAGAADTSPAAETAYEFHFPEPISAPLPVSPAGPPKFAPTDTAGFFRLTLTSPRFGFGQRLYRDVVAATAIANGRRAASWLGAFGKPTPLPKPPLLPKIASLLIDYEAVAEAQMTDPNGAVRMYGLDPFVGIVEARLRTLAAAPVDAPGVLFIGLNGAAPATPLSLFFEIEDGAAAEATGARQHDGAANSARSGVQWRYLSTRGWAALPGQALLGDGTSGMTSSGIVRITPPTDLLTAPGDGPTSWIAVSTSGDAGAYGLVKGPFPHAVAATRDMAAEAEARSEADDDPPAPAIGPSVAPAAPANAITRIETPPPGLKTARQPFPSTPGRAAQTDRDFRVTVSERLSHKNRAIRPDDAPQMVLSAFPEIGAAKCLSPRTGVLTLVVAPARVVGVARPSVSATLRLRIAKFLRDATGLDLRSIRVISPVYETVRLSAELVVSRDLGPAAISHAQDAFAAIIAPWRSDPAAPMRIGDARLSLADIRSRIEARAPGLALSGLSLVQKHLGAPETPSRFDWSLKDTARGVGGASLNGEATPAEPELRAATPASVFIPARRHRLTLIDPEERLGRLAVGQDLWVFPPGSDRENIGAVPTRPRRAGLGVNAIAEDFIVMRAEDAVPPTVGAPHAPIVAAPLYGATAFAPPSFEEDRI